MHMDDLLPRRKMCRLFRGARQPVTTSWNRDIPSLWGCLAHAHPPETPTIGSPFREKTYGRSVKCGICIYRRSPDAGSRNRQVTDLKKTDIDPNACNNAVLRQATRRM